MSGAQAKTLAILRTSQLASRCPGTAVGALADCGLAGRTNGHGNSMA